MAHGTVVDVPQIEKLTAGVNNSMIELRTGNHCGWDDIISVVGIGNLKWREPTTEEEQQRAEYQKHRYSFLGRIFKREKTLKELGGVMYFEPFTEQELTSSLKKFHDETPQRKMLHDNKKCKCYGNK